MRVAILADTHLPRGGRELPPACVEAIVSADAVIHAGDLTGASFLAWLEDAASRLCAVRGNVDDAEVSRRLPADAVLEAGGARLGVVHDAGPARGRLRRLRARFPDADAVVFGHSHLPLHERAGGFQIFNPGSPTERRRAPARTMGIAMVAGPRVRFSHLRLQPREVPAGLRSPR